MAVLTQRELFQPETLTDLVMLRATDEVDYDIDFLAAMQQTDRTRVKMNVRAGTYSRIGQFRADNANTPISTPPGIHAESIEMPIPLLSEKEIMREDLLRLLNSVDEGLATEAMDEILDQGARLKTQNTNLTKLMVWRAAQDILTITYNAAVPLDIDYGLENADLGMSASHLPDVSGTAPWANPATDLVSHVDAWSLLINNDAGMAQSDLTMIISTPILRNMQANTKMMALAGSAADPRRPTLQQLADFFGIKEIIVYDRLYKDMAGVTQRYFPITKVILKVDNIGPVPTIQLFDGPVVRFDSATGTLVTGNNAGALVDTWASPDPPQQNIRVTTARMPIVIREGIVTAKVA
jgi:hypothetical protein